MDKRIYASGINHPMYGKHHTEESISKMRMSHSNPSEETRLKMRLAKLGKKHSPEQIAKQRIAMTSSNHPMFGKTHSKESRDKISKAHLGMKLPPFTQEHRDKISKALIINNCTQRQEVRDKISISVKKLWQNKEYRDKNIKATLKGLMKRPTSYEQKLSNVMIKYNLPFVYCGNGTFLIGHKNPDFINKETKIAIEVYHEFYKIRDYGSCEEYEKIRGDYFAKYGWRTIFIRTDEIESKDYESICLNKIKNG